MYKLIIVDDEYVVIEGIRAIIERMNLSFNIVGTAGNGIKGMEIIEEMKPDVVITDIRMPGKTGLEMIEELEKKCDTQYIVISGHQEFEYARTALRLGVRAYIDKPLTIKGVSSALKEIEEILIEKKSDKSDNVLEEGYIKLRNKLMDAVIADEEEEDWRTLLNNTLTALKNCKYDMEKYKRECYSLACHAAGLFYEHIDKNEKEQHIPLFDNIKPEKDYEAIDSFVLGIIMSIFEKKEVMRIGCVHKSVEKIMNYLEEHYQEDIGLAEAAEMVDMHYTYLSVLFKQEVGMSFVKYLTGIRIKHAKQLLAAGYKVNQVARMTGYNNYRYFCDIFKRLEHMTPNEYKGNVRRNQ